MAVNRRRREGQEQEADFFRVTTWDKLAEICQTSLSKGKKVAVVGAVSVSTYQAKDGTTRASLDLMASEIEFLTPKEKTEEPKAEPKRGGFVEVTEDDIPF